MLDFVWENYVEQHRFSKIRTFPARTKKYPAVNQPDVLQFQ